MNMWSIAEITLGFGVLCLPSMRKMFVEAEWFVKLRTSFTSSDQDRSKEASVEYEVGEGHRSAKAAALRSDVV